MKKTRLTGMLAAAGLTVGLICPAFAQGEDRRRPDRSDRPSGGAPRGAMGLMGALDANRDGKLDQSEIDMAVVSLRKLDKNKDGELTREEMFGGAGRTPGGDRRPGQTGPNDRPPGQLLAALDKNGDGKISKDEAPDRMVENWDRVDTNGDGVVDKEEQAAMIEAMRRRGGGRPPGQDRPQRGRPDRDEGQGGADKPKRPDQAE